MRRHLPTATETPTAANKTRANLWLAAKVPGASFNQVGIASYAAAIIAETTNGYVPRCYLFNPAALGGKTLAALEKIPDRKTRFENQKIIRVKNDHVSSPAMQERIAAFLTLRTLRRIVVPRHLGKVFVVRRELLEPSNRNVFTLHRLESLQSFFSRARGITRPAQDVQAGFPNA